MKNEIAVVKYITGENGSGLYLSPSDLYCLLFLYEQKLLTVKQLNTFRSFFYENKQNFNAFRNRLNKMAKLKIIKKENYYLKKKDGIELGMITIGEKGVFLLQQSGFLPEDIHYSYVSKKQFEHTLGIREVVINTIELETLEKSWMISGEKGEHTYVFNKYISNYGINNIHPFSKWANIPKIIYDNDEWGVNNYEPYNYKAERSNFFDDTLYSISPFKLKHDIQDEDHNLKPDWMFRLNNHYINIEVDTGTERIGVIESKIRRYVKLASMMPNVQHHVIFVLIDDSYQTVFDYGTRKQRALKLKEVIKKMPEFNTSNLNVVVTPMRRVQPIMYQLLKQSKKPLVKEDYYEMLIKRLNNSLTFSYTAEKLKTVESLKKHGFYQKVFLDNTFSVYHFKKKHSKNARGVLEFNAIMLNIQEGDVRAYQLLFELSKLLSNAESDKGRLVLPRDTKVFAIYPNELPQSESAINYDIFHSSTKENAVILMRAEEIFQFNPHFYDVKQRRHKLFEDFF